MKNKKRYLIQLFIGFVIALVIYLLPIEQTLKNGLLFFFLLPLLISANMMLVKNLVLRILGVIIITVLAFIIIKNLPIYPHY